MKSKYFPSMASFQLEKYNREESILKKLKKIPTLTRVKFVLPIEKLLWAFVGCFVHLALDAASLVVYDKLIHLFSPLNGPY